MYKQQAHQTFLLLMVLYFLIFTGIKPQPNLSVTPVKTLEMHEQLHELLQILFSNCIYRQE